MDCIFTKHEFSRFGEGESRLITEDRDGNRKPLLRRKGGYASTLTVKDGQYRLTNSEGATLRQGKADGSPESIFEIYDGMPFDTEPMKVITDNFSGSFEKYEYKYGHGRVERNKKRKFYVYSEAIEGGAAIGVIEHNYGKTYAIHSLYFDEELSRKQKTERLVDHLISLLSPTEYISITGHGLETRIDFGYHDIAKMYGAAYSDKLEQSRLLFLDAIERKESITEVLKPAVKYVPEGIFSEEESGEADNAAEGN